jgi:hypothetical protein
VTDREFAEGAGWKVATDYDTVPHTLVVYHPIRGIHYTGEHAWENAAAWSRSEDRPARPTRTFTVSGTVHLSGGFEVCVGAPDRDAARDAAIALVEGWERADLIDRCGVELQEVCPDNVIEEGE